MAPSLAVMFYKNHYFLSTIKPKHIDVLRKTQIILKRYEKTGYQEEITFEEFFIWCYHFIYTKATDVMGERKMLEAPEKGNFEYIEEE
ncbi:hypothetical protein [Fulvivirga sediminis]|uniref:Uncharacterized protein n=1 Tax=Fulvivirga sediminis TaxID=2803949 RepID=A0A937FD92_9BACT|nr:hypothetical protein [Fulvivirga sediminis]MBL3658293.1 hypothetical protein [Fulvivirga sediminis]